MTNASGNPTPPSAPSPSGEPRWSALAAFVTVAFLPATTARRTEHLKARSVLFVHLVAAFGIAATVFVLSVWKHLYYSADVSVAVARAVGRVLNALDDEAVSLIEATAWRIGCAVLIEGVCLLGAVLCTPWGATDEPLMMSIGNAIRRAWLHTPHLLLVVLLCGGAWIGLMRAEAEAEAKSEDLISPFVADSCALYDAELELEMSVYPFYVRHGEEIGIFLCPAGAAWWLWSLLRCIGTPRRPSPVVSPPTCENCGYNLTGITLDRCCPECGEPSAQSLGPDIRSMTPWQRYHPLGRGQALRRCLTEPILHPRQFGRLLPRSARRCDHRWILAAILPVLFVIGWAGINACELANANYRNGGITYELHWAVGPVVGFFVSVAAVPVSLLTAGIVGLAYRAKSGRSHHAGTMQAACYAAAYFVPWSILAFGVVAGAVAVETSLRAMIPPSYWRAVIIGIIPVLPNLIGLAGYFWLVARITAGMRYANR